MVGYWCCFYIKHFSAQALHSQTITCDKEFRSKSTLSQTLGRRLSPHLRVNGIYTSILLLQSSTASFFEWLATLTTLLSEPGSISGSINVCISGVGCFLNVFKYLYIYFYVLISFTIHYTSKIICLCYWFICVS